MWTAILFQAYLFRINVPEKTWLNFFLFLRPILKAEENRIQIKFKITSSLPL